MTRTCTVLIALAWIGATLPMAPRALAQARPRGDEAAQARKSLVRTLERHAVMIEALVRSLEYRLENVERRGPVNLTDNLVTGRSRSAQQTEATLVRRETTLSAVPGAPNQRTAELGQRVTALRGTVAARLRRLVELVPDLDPSIVNYWDSPPQPGPAPAGGPVRNPTDYVGYVTIEQPSSLDELLGAAGSVEERYLSTKK